MAEAAELLEELLELDRLHRRDGTLSPALSSRRDWLEASVASVVEAEPIVEVDPVAAVRASTHPDGLIPGALTGLGGWIGVVRARTRVVLHGLAALAIAGAGAVGPALDLPLATYLQELVVGPLPLVLLLWGVAYPSLLARAERRASVDEAGLPAIEAPLLVFGALVLGGLLFYRGEPWPVWIGAFVLLFGVATLAMTLVRPGARNDLARRVGRAARVEGLAALESLDAPRACEALEIAAVLAPGEDEDEVEELSSSLTVALLLEAEHLRLGGRRLGARALLSARGVRPEGRSAERALERFSRRVRAPRAELFEAAGLPVAAAREYREQGRLPDAIRCYTTAAERATHRAARCRAAAGIVELGAPLHPRLLEDLLDEVEVRGGAASEVLAVLAKLPETTLRSFELAQNLERRLLPHPPERAISVIEAIVAKRPPKAFPALFRLLAGSYRRLGHKGTAKRIEAELGGLASGPVSSSFVGRPEDLDTSDLENALSDRYDLLGRLGSGAMGEVHLAEDRRLGRKVALKVLRPQMASEFFIERFRDEARVVARLNHPGIVRAFDAGQVGPWAYFVMELVDGPDLATVMARPSRPSLARRVGWIVEVAEAMAYAHEQGVIHRDLKPANVLVAADGRARVTDFGIAHVSGSSPDATAFSEAGLQVGTPLYMAPEQLGYGKPASVRTDVYALGMTLFFVATGKLPFGEDDIFSRLRALPPSVRAVASSLSVELDAVVAESLAPEPELRLGSMEELAQRLRGCPELGPPRRLASC